MRTGILAIALENSEDITIGAVDNVVGETMTHFIDEPTQDGMQAEEAMHEFLDIDNRIDEAQQTAFTMHDMADRLEETIADGGASAEAVGAINEALEHMLERVGMSRTKLIAVESFSDKDNTAQTKIAVESIRETISKVWKAIVEAVQKAMDWLVEFFDMSARKAAGLAKRAQDLFTRADKGYTASGKIEMPAVLVRDNKVLNGQFLYNRYKELMEMQLIKTDDVTDIKNALTAITQSINDPEFDAPASVWEAIKFDKIGEPANNVDAPEGMMARQVKLPIGDVSFYILYPSDTNKANELKSRLGFAGAAKTYIDKTSGTKEPTSMQADAIDCADAKDLAELVKTHMSGYEKISQHMREATRAAKAAITAAKTKLKSDEDAQNDLNEFTGGVRCLINTKIKGAGVIRSYDIKIADAILKAIGLSIKTHVAAK